MADILSSAIDSTFDVLGEMPFAHRLEGALGGRGAVTDYVSEEVAELGPALSRGFGAFGARIAGGEAGFIAHMNMLAKKDEKAEDRAFQEAQVSRAERFRERMLEVEQGHKLDLHGRDVKAREALQDRLRESVERVAGLEITAKQTAADTAHTRGLTEAKRREGVARDVAAQLAKDAVNLKKVDFNMTRKLKESDTQAMAEAVIDDALLDDAVKKSAQNRINAWEVDQNKPTSVWSPGSHTNAEIRNKWLGIHDKDIAGWTTSAESMKALQVRGQLRGAKNTELAKYFGVATGKKHPDVAQYDSPNDVPDTKIDALLLQVADSPAGVFMREGQGMLTQVQGMMASLPPNASSAAWVDRRDQLEKIEKRIGTLTTADTQLESYDGSGSMVSNIQQGIESAKAGVEGGLRAAIVRDAKTQSTNLYQPDHLLHQMPGLTKDEPDTALFRDIVQAPVIPDTVNQSIANLHRLTTDEDTEYLHDLKNDPNLRDTLDFIQKNGEPGMGGDGIESLDEFLVGLENAWKARGVTPADAKKWTEWSHHWHKINNYGYTQAQLDAKGQDISEERVAENNKEMAVAQTEQWLRAFDRGSGIRTPDATRAELVKTFSDNILMPILSKAKPGIAFVPDLNTYRPLIDAHINTAYKMAINSGGGRDGAIAGLDAMARSYGKKIKEGESAQYAVFYQRAQDQILDKIADLKGASAAAPANSPDKFDQGANADDSKAAFMNRLKPTGLPGGVQRLYINTPDMIDTVIVDLSGVGGNPALYQQLSGMGDATFKQEVQAKYADAGWDKLSNVSPYMRKTLVKELKEFAKLEVQREKILELDPDDIGDPNKRATLVAVQTALQNPKDNQSYEMARKSFYEGAETINVKGGEIRGTRGYSKTHFTGIRTEKMGVFNEYPYTWLPLKWVNDVTHPVGSLHTTGELSRFQSNEIDVSDILQGMDTTEHGPGDMVPGPWSTKPEIVAHRNRLAKELVDIEAMKAFMAGGELQGQLLPGQQHWDAQGGVIAGTKAGGARKGYLDHLDIAEAIARNKTGTLNLNKMIRSEEIKPHFLSTLSYPAMFILGGYKSTEELEPGDGISAEPSVQYNIEKGKIDAPGNSALTIQEINDTLPEFVKNLQKDNILAQTGLEGGVAGVKGKQARTTLGQMEFGYSNNEILKKADNGATILQGGTGYIHGVIHTLKALFELQRTTDSALGEGVDAKKLQREVSLDALDTVQGMMTKLATDPGYYNTPLREMSIAIRSRVPPDFDTYPREKKAAVGVLAMLSSTSISESRTLPSYTKDDAARAVNEAKQPKTSSIPAVPGAEPTESSVEVLPPVYFDDDSDDPEAFTTAEEWEKAHPEAVKEAEEKFGFRGTAKEWESKYGQEAQEQAAAKKKKTTADAKRIAKQVRERIKKEKEAKKKFDEDIRKKAEEE